MRLASFLLFLLFGLWCAPVFATSPVLRGVVFEAEGGQGPLSGIQIETENGAKVTTNKDGGFALPFQTTPLRLWVVFPDGTRLQTEPLSPSLVGESEVLLTISLSPANIATVR